MNSYSVTLSDADEIEQFYVDTTGNRPGFLQLSPGRVDLGFRVYEIAGVTLVWARVQGRTRWRDEMLDDPFHLGFPIAIDGKIVARGQAVDAGEAQVWVPGEEMDALMVGPLLTLEVGVDSGLVEQLGWQVEGEPIRKVSKVLLERLANTCRHASLAFEQGLCGSDPESWRDHILDEMEQVIRPWLSLGNRRDLLPASGTRHYRLIRRADAFFELIDGEGSFTVEQLAEFLGVPRRTVFHAYRKLLGVGPRRYFELRRLQTLRSRLTRASGNDTTVTDIATELGFANLGRLAGLYRSQFGETPGQTLKRT